MGKVIVVGGGWAGCSAAVIAVKQGAQVTLLEKTDLLLGAGNVGGIMRNNGRFTAAEENIALGAGALFSVTDRLARHQNVDFPGHAHASFYDVGLVEPAVRQLLLEMGVEIHFVSRVIDVRLRPSAQIERLSQIGDADSGTKAADADGRTQTAGGPKPAQPPLRRLEAVLAMEKGTPHWYEGDVFIETTGSSGPMGNCSRYGNGCAMCIQRCPTFGPRESLTALAGAWDLTGHRANGKPGAFSGSCKLDKRSLSKALQDRLDIDGFAVIPLPTSLIKREKLQEKVCQQYALDEFAENIILLDTGQAKLMTPFFPLEELRTIKGFERARYADPYAGGLGNSLRYMSVGEREKDMRAKGFENLYLGGEKSGFFVGHTEAISTGALAGYNGARAAGGRLSAAAAPAEGSATEAAAAFAEGPMVKSVSADAPEARVATASADGSAGSAQGLVLPRSLAIGELLAYAHEVLKEPDGLSRRLTFAGGEFFRRMKALNLYTTDRDAVRDRVQKAGLLGIYDRQT